LYDIEEQCKLLQFDLDSITEKRQAESLPILQAFRQWLEETLPQTIPRTPIHKAINYALKNYNGLVQYTSDGMLSVDNNQLEGKSVRLPLDGTTICSPAHTGAENLQRSFTASWLPVNFKR
jgi:hypothetical protein